jgi:ribulose-phosphate 3-epimerase
VTGEPQISASILNADFARLGAEVERAADGGVDSIHLDIMDGHFVDNLTMGPVVVEAVRSSTGLPFHAHLMISNPLAYAERFADAGSDLIVFHVEADDDPAEVIDRIERAGKRPGIALNPETEAASVEPWLVNLDTIGRAHDAGGEVLVVGSGLYSSDGDLTPTVAALRAAALARDADIDAERT